MNRVTWRVSALALATSLSLLLVVACSKPAPAPESSSASAPAPSAAPAAAQPEPKTVADIFPAGPGKEQVLNNCASCHNVACSTIGQRSAERWAALKKAHKDRVNTPDYDLIFSYLESHFSDKQPEPTVPPQFLEGGCTPV